VIVGRLIPAGTGLAFHRARKVKEQLEAQEQAAMAAAEAEALFAPAPGEQDAVEASEENAPGSAEA